MVINHQLKVANKQNKQNNIKSFISTIFKL